MNFVNKKMYKLIFLLLSMVSLMVNAQNNTFLSSDFWRSNPGIESVKSEIAKGNNPLEENTMHMDAVTLAINSNASGSVICFLLDQKGIDLNKPQHEKRAYLHWATLRGNVEVVDYLIKKGADIYLEDDRDLSPLFFAINNGSCNKEIIELFLKAGFDLRKKNSDGANLLLISAPYDKDMVVTNFLVGKGLSIQSADDNGATAFDYAARKGNVEIMKALLAKGVKSTDNALLMAAQGTRREANGVDVYKYLIGELKLKATVKDKSGNTLLHLITRKQNQAEVLAYLLGNGADANALNADGDNALMLAAAGRDAEVLKILLSKTKNVNAVNAKGVSALCNAVAGSTVESIRLLLDKKANINVVDKAGNNLAYYLMQSFRPAGGRGGRGGFGGGDAASVKSPLETFTEKMDLLKIKGLQPTKPQKDGSTLLHYAVTKGDLDFVKAIYALGGMDINAQNEDGQTALHRAAITAQNDQILKYLISVGADKNIKTSFDESAYDFVKNNESFKKQNIDLSFLK